ncbi:MAG: hypothetical protein Ct9H300mP4_15330 [Gammaproteobacteria bacterium]|nr:MAG: hypothetical protein Ct9H300mP4_15330 [Gammaproteobacteria bacterium]
MQWTEEHESIRETVAKFVDNEINPYVDQWEDDGIFPAKEVFKKLGDLGMLGITKPIEYGGLGLDYSYGIVFAEEWAHQLWRCINPVSVYKPICRPQLWQSLAVTNCVMNF